MLLLSGHDVLVNIVVGAAGDGNSNGVVQDNRESMMDNVNENGVLAGDVVGLAKGGGLFRGVRDLSVEEAEEEFRRLVDADGTEEGADGGNQTVGEHRVLHLGGVDGVSLGEGLVHLEGELHGSANSASGEDDEGHHVDSLGEAEQVTGKRVTTVGLEGGALKSVSVGRLDANVNGGLGNPDGGENTSDDANDTTGGGVEDGDCVLEDGVTLGAEEAPESGNATDEQRSQVVVVVLRLDVVDHGVELRPVVAGIEDAGLGGILHRGALAVGGDRGAISAALVVVEERISLQVSNEGGDIGEAAAAGAAEREGARSSSHCYFIVFN